MAAKLYHMHWFKHSSYSDKEPNYKADFEYHVDGLGSVKITTEIPKSLAERFDAIGKQALWEKIGKARK